ncbi:MAG TPA: pyridoxamine 5'-phosphate oxidase family protein [Leptolyngbyaceae cyanobacterium]
MSVAKAENGWVNTVDAQKPEVLEKAQHIIESNLYCTLSTCSSEGFPWASPVFFAHDQAWNLYWSSATVSQHSQNLYRNQGRTAIAIYSTSVDEGKGQGLYLSGTASELAPERTPEIIKLLLQKLMLRGGTPPVRTAADYLPPSYRRIYHFQTQAVWITGERAAFGNVLVDTKIQLNLSDLVRSQL